MLQGNYCNYNLCGSFHCLAILAVRTQKAGTMFSKGYSQFLVL